MPERLIRGGHEAGLHFEIRWPSEAGSLAAAQATSGYLKLRLAGRPVWPRVADARGQEWSWIELLEHLGRNWGRLRWEESYPCGLQPSAPSGLRLLAERRWEEMSDIRVQEEEGEVWSFEEAHDLSQALQGLWAAPLWVLREGGRYLLSAETATIRRPASEVLATLEDLGHALSDRLEGCIDGRSNAARTDWGNREGIEPEDWLVLVSGLGTNKIDEICNDRSREDVFGLNGRNEPTELLAAARMSRSQPPDVISRILDAIRSIPQGRASKMDDLSLDARGVLRPRELLKPYEQGHILADWLCKTLDLEGRKDPEALLESWGVEVAIRDLGLTIDAVSCWGPAHGPAVILDRSLDSPGQTARRRSSLAHEICHLLIDREGALPLAEVLGGHVPTHLEARARAFAAQFLLPMNLAGDALLRASDPAAEVTRLRRRFGVSGEVVAWQARNSPSGGMLPRATFEYLRGLVSDRERF